MAKEKIKFLATGDIHSDMTLMKQMGKHPDFDTLDFIVLIGDISEHEDDYGKLLKVFKRKKIFMVPGNHESKSQIEKLKKHYNVHLIGNNPVKINENLVLFGSNYLPIGPFGIPEQQIFNNLVKNYEAIKDVPCKVHLSHMPPSDTKIGDASPFMPFIGGSKAVKKFLENFKPNMTLVGHIHESSGLEEIVNKTNVLNVGRTFRVIEFDNKTKKLTILES